MYHDPSVPSGPRKAFVPASPYYDGRARDWQVDADGRHVSAHPIDSGVQLAMFLQKGELRSSPTTGNDLLQIQDLTGPRRQSEAERIVREAQPIARYLAEGAVTITRIDSEYRSSTGALLVELWYRNNITAKDETARSRA